MLVTLVLLLALIGWHVYKVRHHQNGTSTSSTVKLTNVSYGPYPRQVLDVYGAAGAAKAQPIVVMVHGGGWSAGDKSSLSTDAQTLASANFTVFNIDYRLDSSQLPGYPMELNDVEAAIKWAIQNGPKYGGDVHNVMLIGGSAGANLVDLAGPLLNQQQPHTVAAVVSLSSATDLVALTSELYQLAGANPGVYSMQLTNLSQLLGCKVIQNNCSLTTEQNTSPIDIVTAANCPAFLNFNSQNEKIPLPQATSFNDKLKQLGCQATLQILPGTAHAFAYFTNVQSTIISYLKAH